MPTAAQRTCPSVDVHDALHRCAVLIGCTSTRTTCQPFTTKARCSERCCCAAAEAGEARRAQVAAAVARASAARDGPRNNVVAVKLQYPDALPLFTQDLKNIRGLAGFLTKTELQFDMVSAVDELSTQVQLEFDFQRCAPRPRYVRPGSAYTTAVLHACSVLVRLRVLCVRLCVVCSASVVNASHTSCSSWQYLGLQGLCFLALLLRATCHRPSAHAVSSRRAACSEARVMDTVAEDLRPIARRVRVPRSVPGLVTERLLTMHFLPGLPLTQLGQRGPALSERQKRAAMSRVRARLQLVGNIRCWYEAFNACRFEFGCDYTHTASMRVCMRTVQGVNCTLAAGNGTLHASLWKRCVTAGHACVDHQPVIGGVRAHGPGLRPLPGGRPPRQHPRHEGRRRGAP